MRKVLAAMLLTLVAGCGTYNPLRWVGLMDPIPNEPTKLTPITATVQPKASWTASVGKAGGFTFRPVIVGSKVYTASAEGVVTVLDEGDGRVLSRFETKKNLSGGVEVGENRIVVGTSKGDVIALDATNGNIAWTTQVNGEVIAPASVSRGIAVVRTADGRIYGLAVADGKRQWVYQRASPPLLLRSEAGVLAIARDVVAGYPNGKLIALDLEDGKLTWEATVSPPRGSTELERIADVAGLPLVDGPRVCAAAFQGKVACLEIQTRNVVWARDVSSSSTLVADAKNIYLNDDTSSVHALAKDSGASVWKQSKLLHRRLTSPVVFDGKVVVGDLEGYIHVLAPEDGALIGRLATDGSPIRILVATLSGLLVQTEKGSVVMVRF
jgi:outer membrane protein assembly factor BamB